MPESKQQEPLAYSGYAADSNTKTTAVSSIYSAGSKAQKEAAYGYYQGIKGNRQRFTGRSVA